MEAKEELPEYMKPVYAAMLKFGNELADKVFKNNGLDVLPYIKKEVITVKVYPHLFSYIYRASVEGSLK